MDNEKLLKLLKKIKSLNREEDLPLRFELLQEAVSVIEPDISNSDWNEVFEEITLLSRNTEVLNQQADTLLILGNICIEQWKISKGPNHAEQNLNRAIQCFLRALQLFDLEKFYFEWAYTSFRLGFAFNVSRSGNRESNLELAIKFYEAALSIFRSENNWDLWASTLLNLGSIYSTRARGNLEENKETAIQLYEQALSVFNENESFLNERTDILSRLAVLYANRSLGDERNNFERARNYLRAIRLAYLNPSEQINLAYLYSQLYGENEIENFENSHKIFHDLLNQQTSRNNPEFSAHILTLMGDTFLQRRFKNREINVRQALFHYKKAKNFLNYYNDSILKNTVEHRINSILEQHVVDAYAVARIKNYKNGENFYINREFIIEAGLKSMMSEEFYAVPIQLPLEDTTEIDIVVHAEDMKVLPDWIQNYKFTERYETPLIEFMIVPQEVGAKLIRVEFLYKRHWLGNIKFEINVIKPESLY